MKDLGPGSYLPGMWRGKLKLQLVWRGRGRLCSEYRAPSWSWASLEGETYHCPPFERYQRVDDFATTTLAKVLDVHVEIL